MHRRWFLRVLAVPNALLAVTLAASIASAQSIVFSGRVTAQGGQPLPGASVGIPDLGAGGIAGEDGRYNFTVEQTRLRGRAVNLIARMIGYKPVRVPLNNVTANVTRDFGLERDVLNLEQVVVTGVSEATSQRKTPFAVSVVDNTQLREVPSVGSPVAVLQGKVAGASLVTTSGSPGSAP
ncbi:MAG: carboxypeptidase-like regulatory domain-containing protein, partial [Gemmatimonadaceae bacterium]